MSIDGKDLCDKVIDMASGKGVTYVEARFVQNQNNQFILKNGTPELGVFDRTSGIGLRLIVDGAMGFASFNSFDNETMEMALNQAIKLAKSSTRLRKTPIVFSEEKTNIKKYSVQGEKADPEEKMKMLFEIDKSISSLPIPFRLVFLMDSETRRYFVNSDGSQVESYTPRLNFYSILTAVDATRGSMEQAHYSKGASGGFEWVKKWNLYEFLRNEATILSKVASEAKDPPKGNIDIVIGSELAGLIAHENCGHPSEADRILGREAAQAGESFLSIDKLGEKIGSDYVTIIDDPSISGSYGYYLVDEEGISSRPRYLIKNGVFNEMLHNRESAGFLNTQSTGAARATGFNREPIPRMACTYIKEGDFSFEEIFEGIKLGIYIKTNSEWNIDDRRFQCKYVGREAYLIRDGELIDEMVKRPTIETTTPELFQAIDATSDKLEFDSAFCGKGDPPQAIPVWHGGPEATRLRNILVR